MFFVTRETSKKKLFVIRSVCAIIVLNPELCKVTCFRGKLDINHYKIFRPVNLMAWPAWHDICLNCGHKKQDHCPDSRCQRHIAVVSGLGQHF